MKQKLIFFCMATIMTMSESNADDKSFAYNMIKVCQSYIDENGKMDEPLLHGVVTGLAVAYMNTIRKNNIDNEYAPLTPGEYGKRMCQIALNYRLSENKKTGGKYNVTNFYPNLIDAGFYMSLPPSQDSNTTN